MKNKYHIRIGLVKIEKENRIVIYSSGLDFNIKRLRESEFESFFIKNLLTIKKVIKKIIENDRD